jgi:hypothetical protein
MKNIIKLTLLSSTLALGFTSCKKSFLDKTPTAEASMDQVFKDVSGAKAAVNGIIRYMYDSPSGAQHNCFGQPSMNIMYDLLAEDLVQIAQGHWNGIYSYSLVRNPSATTTAGYSWSYYYKIINNANILLENIDAVKGDQAEKDFIKAQGLFFRAFAYYNLANQYAPTYKFMFVVDLPSTSSAAGYNGDVLNSPCVPLYVKSTQTGKPRATVQDIYTQITDDLTEAITLFDGSGISRGDKSNPDGNVARGLMARVALIKQDWTNASKFASEARQGFAFGNSTQVLGGFNDINSSEWIWGLGINSEQSTIYASLISFFDRDAGGYALIHSAMVLNKPLVDTLTADSANDVRRGWFLSRNQVSRDPKYKGFAQNEQRKFKLKVPNTFLADYPLMRSAEMALIEAEAEAQKGNLVVAGTLLEDLIKTRNPAFVARTTSKTELVKQIWFQRRIELWGEGFRFFDCKRMSANFAGVSMQDDKDRGIRRTTTGQAINSATRSIDPGSPFLNFRFVSNEILYNPGLLQNP